MTNPTVAIVGAECTGKTTLCNALAKHYNGNIAQEYLREFVTTHARTPKQSEQLLIAQTMLNRIQTLSKQRFTICDTTPLITAIYSEYYFNDTSLDTFKTCHEFDLYVLCSPDFDWQPDGLQRDSAAVALQIHTLIMQNLQHLNLPFITLNGNEAQRFTTVTNAIDNLLP